LQIQKINETTLYKNNYPQSINGVNYKSTDNRQTSFKSGEEIMVITVITFFFWNGVLAIRRLRKTFFKRADNDNNQQ